MLSAQQRLIQRKPRMSCWLLHLVCDFYFWFSQYWFLIKLFLLPDLDSAYYATDDYVQIDIISILFNTSYACGIPFFPLLWFAWVPIGSTEFGWSALIHEMSFESTFVTFFVLWKALFTRSMFLLSTISTSLRKWKIGDLVLPCEQN